MRRKTLVRHTPDKLWMQDLLADSEIANETQYWRTRYVNLCNRLELKPFEEASPKVEAFSSIWPENALVSKKEQEQDFAEDFPWLA